jgi:Beta-propeller repeat
MSSRHVRRLSVLGTAALAVLCVALLAPSVAGAAGGLIWARGVEFRDTNEQFLDLAKGPNGSVYAVGRAKYAAGEGDLLVARFSSGGKLLWRRVVDGAAHGDDWGRAVAVDRAGNALVTGTSDSALHGVDAITIKYSPAGKKLWTRRYNGMADAYDEGVDVAVDGAGAAFVAITSTVMGGKNIVVVKYRAGGGKAWEAMWAGPGVDDWAKALALDARGRVYVVGIADTFTNGLDAVLLRIDGDGSVKWHKMYDGAAHLDDRGAKVMVRGSYVYMMGVSDRVGLRPCFLAAKYGLLGGLKWARVSDMAGDVDSSAGIWVDGDGNVSVSGDLTVSGPEGRRGAIVSWNRYGVFRWQRTYYGVAAGEPVGFSTMTGGAGGAVYCGGWVGRGAAYDSLVVKYRQDGRRVWARPFNSDPYEGAYTGCLLLTGGSGAGLYAGGALSVGASSYSALLLKYRP